MLAAPVVMLFRSGAHARLLVEIGCRHAAPVRGCAGGCDGHRRCRLAIRGPAALDS
jgi:hypothetical protein